MAKNVGLFPDLWFCVRTPNDLHGDFNIFPLWLPCVTGLRRGGAALSLNEGNSGVMI